MSSVKKSLIFSLAVILKFGLCIHITAVEPQANMQDIQNAMYHRQFRYYNKLSLSFFQRGLYSISQMIIELIIVCKKQVGYV